MREKKLKQKFKRQKRGNRINRGIHLEGLEGEENPDFLKIL